FNNERGEFLMTTLPVSPVGGPPKDGIVLLPHFAAGGGWTTQIILTNPGDAALSGTVQFFGPGSTSQSASPLNIAVNGSSAATFPYTIPPRSSVHLVTGNADSVLIGSVRVIPATNNAAPGAFAIFSFKQNGITTTEASVLAAPAGNAFEVYAESS